MIEGEKKMNKTYIIGLVFIAGLTGGFFSGLKYQQLRSPSIAQNFMMRGGGGNGKFIISGGKNSGIRPVYGEILERDNNTITVKLQDGGSKLVLVNGKTQVNKAKTVNIDQLSKGQTVTVFGNVNSDGSITASIIQLNPLGHFGENRGLKVTMPGK